MDGLYAITLGYLEVGICSSNLRFGRFYCTFGSSFVLLLSENGRHNLGLVQFTGLAPCITAFLAFGESYMQGYFVSCSPTQDRTGVARMPIGWVIR